MPTGPMQSERAYTHTDTPTGFQACLSPWTQSWERAKTQYQSNLRKKMGAASPGPSSASPWLQPQLQPAFPQASC